MDVDERVDQLQRDLEDVQRDVKTLARHVAGLAAVGEGAHHLQRGELVPLHRVRCNGCGRTADTRTISRSEATRRFERAGWRLVTGSWECPSCVAAASVVESNTEHVEGERL